MKAFNSCLFSILFLIAANASAQNLNGFIWGEYSVLHVNQPIRKPDSLPRIGLPNIDALLLIEFDKNHTLQLKWNKRFTITNSRPITAHGLQTDNPTIHGSYKIKNDTLILTYRYTIQHFNRISPKSRLKTKYNRGNLPRPVKQFARTENGQFKISNYGFWYKNED